MKIVVTGGAGFIGSHIVDSYIDSGHEVLILDNLSSGVEANLNKKASFQNIDITSPEVGQVIKDFAPEVINHHAAQINVRESVSNPSFDAKVNILGSLNLLEAAKQASVKHFIFASTGGAVYGDTDTIPTPEDHQTQPLSPYGISKRSVELYLHYYAKSAGINYIILRYSNVYGPRQNPHGEAGVVAIYYQRMIAGKPFVINGDGQQTRDFVFVKDVVKANQLALNLKSTETINIATSTETSVNQLVDQMQKSLSRKGEIPHGPAKDGEQQRSCLDISKAEKILGWAPSFDLSQGLAQTSDFFQKQP